MNDTQARVTGPTTAIGRLLRAPMVPTALAMLYRPLQKLIKPIHLHRRRNRRFNTDDVLVPAGFTVEVVASGLHEPVHCCFDDAGACYVIECGHKIESKPRVIKVDVVTGSREVFFELPEDRWNATGAVTGGTWHDGYLYLMNTDTLSRITPDGRLEDVVTGLPSLGDHQTNYPVVGPDGKIYFGQGTYTNSGVVGVDNYAYEWLPTFPDRHDVPGADVVLAGNNYEFPDILNNPLKRVKTGAFVRFGTETHAGQVIPGDVKANGSVLRCNPDGSELELVAWGLRNPYGIAFAPDGRLYATEHGMDERNARYIVGDLEDFYEIVEGAWYGWPDFASGVRLDDPSWGTSGRGREPVLARHPDPDPPKPLVSFPPHAAPNGVDFCRDAGFGFEGDAFIALFGDLAPVTSRLATPSGFKVVRVNVETRKVEDFAVNTINGPASRLPHAGMERPSHCQFGPDGSLYIVDFGEISIAPEKGGIRVWEGSGALWRIRRTDGPIGDAPVNRTVPSYAIKAAAMGGLIIGAIAAAIFVRSRRR